MKIIKVTSTCFDKVKAYAQIALSKDTATKFGLSVGTVNIIKRCESYANYLEYQRVKSSEAMIKKTKNLNLPALSGENLFWTIHSDGRFIPIKILAMYSNLSRDEIKAMKRASDYEEYKKCPTLPYSEAREEWNFTLEAKMDVRNLYKDGYTIEELARMYAVSSEEIQNILKEGADSEPKVHTRTIINEGIFEIIQKGLEQGLSVPLIANTMGIAEVSIRRVLYRIRKGKSYGGSYGLSKVQWEEGRKGHLFHQTTGARTRELKETLAKYNDYYEWSMAYYCRRNVPFWMQRTQKKKIEGQDTQPDNIPQHDVPNQTQVIDLDEPEETDSVEEPDEVLDKREIELRKLDIEELKIRSRLTITMTIIVEITILIIFSIAMVLTKN